MAHTTHDSTTWKSGQVSPQGELRFGTALGHYGCLCYWSKALETNFIRVTKSSLAANSPINLNLSERFKLMTASQLFAGVSTGACMQMAERARARVFARNELLFMQGELFRTVILIGSGCIKLTQLSANGNEVILAMRGACDTIDLSAGPTFRRHTLAARAVVRCQALTWNTSVVEDLMTTTPQFGGNVRCILASQLQELQERYHEMSVDRVERRLARALIRLSEKFGTVTGEGTEVSISRQELAQMTGTTLFTVSRTISKWGDLGLVLPRREAVLVLDRERLEIVSSRDTESSQRRISPMDDDLDLVPSEVLQPAAQANRRSWL